jgi:DNA-binding NarL/FixJ family response regulator
MTSKEIHRVLLIEDNLIFRHELKDFIQSKFPLVKVEEAADGREALEKTQNSLPRLVFMDVRLPGQNGLELTGKIKAMYPDTLVVVLTDYDFHEYRERAKHQGADAFLSKDAPLEEIEGWVRKIV